MRRPFVAGMSAPQGDRGGWIPAIAKNDTCIVIPNVRYLRTLTKDTLPKDDPLPSFWKCGIYAQVLKNLLVLRIKEVDPSFAGKMLLRVRAMVSF